LQVSRVLLPEMGRLYAAPQQNKHRFTVDIIRKFVYTCLNKTKRTCQMFSHLTGPDQTTGLSGGEAELILSAFCPWWNIPIRGNLFAPTLEAIMKRAFVLCVSCDDIFIRKAVVTSLTVGESTDQVETHYSKIYKGLPGLKVVATPVEEARLMDEKCVSYKLVDLLQKG
jgi:hypothetical protein